MSVVTYAGEPCISPNEVRDVCARRGLPLDWYGLPNGFTNPLGVESGRGHVLLSRASLDKIGLDGERDLVLSADSATLGGKALPAATVTLKNLHITRARCLTPGLRGDPNATYLVELADRRALAAMRVINYGLNMRVPSGEGDYLPGSTYSGVTPWTWSQAVGLIWSACSFLGSYPDLPYSPANEPLNAGYFGMPALQALGSILAELGLSLRLDLETGAFHIVDLADDDAGNEALLVANDSLRIYDDDEALPTYGRIPAKVSVRFRSSPTTSTWAGASWYSVEVTDPNGVAPGADPDAIVILEDDFTAWFDMPFGAASGGALLNGAALTARANERAEAYFDQLRASRFRRVFGLPLSGARPGPRVRSVFHGDRGGGMVTEVMRAAVPEWTGRRPLTPPPTLTVTLSAGSGATSSAMAYVLGLDTRDGFYFRNTATAGPVLGQLDADATWASTLYTYQDGKVGHAAQTWGGKKTFLDPVTIGDTHESRLTGNGSLTIVRDATRFAQLGVTVAGDAGSSFVSRLSAPIDAGWLSVALTDGVGDYTVFVVTAYDTGPAANKNAGYGIMNSVGTIRQGKWGQDAIGNFFEGGIITVIGTTPLNAGFSIYRCICVGGTPLEYTATVTLDTGFWTVSAWSPTGNTCDCSASGGGGGGGGDPIFTDCCGAVGVPSNLQAVFSGAFSATINLTYDAGSGWWLGTVPAGTCVEASAFQVIFQCVGGTWKLVGPSAYFPPAGLMASGDASTCDPFVFDKTFTACSASERVVITEHP